MKIKGHRLCEFRCRDFYINGELISPCILLFIKSDNGYWYSLSISEGSAQFLSLKSEPKCETIDEIPGSFSYPVRKMKELESYQGVVVKEIYEYRMKSNPEFVSGIYFELNSGGFSAIEEDGSLTFFSGIAEHELGSYGLIPF